MNQIGKKFHMLKMSDVGNFLSNTAVLKLKGEELFHASIKTDYGIIPRSFAQVFNNGKKLWADCHTGHLYDGMQCVSNNFRMVKKPKPAGKKVPDYFNGQQGELKQ